jgi:hypothetical protein
MFFSENELVSSTSFSINDIDLFWILKRHVNTSTTKPAPPNIIAPILPDLGTPSAMEEKDHAMANKSRNSPNIKPTHAIRSRL